MCNPRVILTLVCTKADHGDTVMVSFNLVGGVVLGMNLMSFFYAVPSESCTLSFVFLIEGVAREPRDAFPLAAVGLVWCP